jgi:uncharacterized repeat protein (TIGR03803 family)
MLASIPTKSKRGVFRPNSMKLSKITVRLTMTFALLFLFIRAQSAVAQTETVLYSFKGGASDGQYPHGRLFRDLRGNLYGTTYQGGTHNGGLVFELSPSGSTWKETVLYNLGGVLDGKYPWSGLVRDSNGNFYGTTEAGGLGQVGTVFEVTPGITWTETGLYSFTGGADGSHPYDTSSLLLDSSGNFYGTTHAGGAGQVGTVFEVIPPVPPSTVWTKKLLHSFSGNAGDGSLPYAGLIMDSGGNLYGTTFEGGAYGVGIVFELSPSESIWTETVLWIFGAGDGRYPWGGLVQDLNGNLYGTTYQGGLHSGGTVFKLSSPSGSGSWTESVIHSFGGTGDGYEPYDALVMDSRGNLYGTTYGGGGHNRGIVFKLSRFGLGTWTESVLYSFKGGVSDGDYPEDGGLIIDGHGNLYGVTALGGGSGCAQNGCGTVFKVVP